MTNSHFLGTESIFACALILLYAALPTGYIMKYMYLVIGMDKKVSLQSYQSLPNH